MKADIVLQNEKGITSELINKIKNYNMSSDYGSETDGQEIDTSPVHAACSNINKLRPFPRLSHTKLKLFIDLYEIIPDYSILIYMR
ncbi:MAG: hypothetical protein JW982_00385 [Spirochaetes bacterium]|nr:hypothetical protein [Spirochaetota bacterium]